MLFRSAETVESEQEMISGWMESGEEDLLAIDDGLLEQMDEHFLKRLSSSSKLHVLPIPGGKSLGPEASQHHRITTLIRKAVGFHITFKGEEKDGES